MLRSITLRYIVLCRVTLRYILYITLNYVVLRYVTLHSLYYIKLRRLMLRYVFNRKCKRKFKMK